MKYKGLSLKPAGYKPEISKEMAKAEVSDNPKVRYAKLFVDDREIPAIADLEFKDECIMVALIKVDRKSTEEVEENEKKKVRVSANFDILAASFVPVESGKKKLSEMDEKEVDSAINSKESRSDIDYDS